MTQPLVRHMKGMPVEHYACAQGVLDNDWKALNPLQEKCTQRLTQAIQLEQEGYLIKHPEIIAMLKLFVSNIEHQAKRSEILQQICSYFTKPVEELDAEIRNYLNLPSGVSYMMEDKALTVDTALEADLTDIILKHNVLEPLEIPTPDIETNTTSSSFVSVVSSVSTPVTPEPIPTPEPTISEIMFKVVANTLDKATFSGVTDEMLKYDTAYVELMKAVEQAMEIPVIDIRKDIAVLFNDAYNLFEADILEKERIAAQLIWEKRMRKKLKRILRRQKNFIGYETPPSSKSEISSHESYRQSPPEICKCHPQWTYNRYPKDRFGIYLPNVKQYSKNNITLTPIITEVDLNAKEKKGA